MDSRCQMFCAWIRRMCLGSVVLLGASDLTAQVQTWRPPSRALPGTSIHAQLRPAWQPTASNEPEHVAPPVEVPVEEPEVVLASQEEILLASDEVLFDSEVRCFGERVFCRPVAEVPNMFGDLFGTGTDLLTIRGNQLLNAAPGIILDPATLGTGALNSFELISPANSVVGRQKVANNNSPLPRDRVFLNYDYAANAILQDGGVGLHRFTPGLERTFFAEMASWEVRVPMAITLDSDPFITGGSSRDQAELGNVYLALKGILWSSDEIVISAGLGSSMPTADSLRFFNANRRELVRVENRSFHLLPYLAGAWSDGGFFFQGFLQGDVDLNGNPVEIDNGTGLRSAGDFQDAGYLSLDLGAGYWLIRDRRDGWITGIAPTAELHYNTALASADGVETAEGIDFGERKRRPEFLNLVVGVTFQIAARNTLALGYTSAIGGDEQFDDGLQVLLNWYYGGN